MKKTPNVQRPTSNIELQKLAPDVDAFAKVLTWIGLYVTQINTLETRNRSQKVELIAQDGCVDMVIVRRVGKDVPTAFFKCVAVAMKQLPKPEAKE